MNTITQLQAKVTKIASKNVYRAALNAVQVITDGERCTVVATDSYKLLAISTPDTSKPSKAVYRINQLNENVQIAKIKKLTEVELPEASDLQFPNWENAKPQLEGARQVTVDRKYLLELLQAIDSSQVVITLPQERNQAITFEATTDPDHEYYGMLMPMRA